MKADTYLTKILISRQGYIALRLKDQYSLHRIVYDLFDDIRTDKEKQLSLKANIVWKDLGFNDNRRVILIITDRKPRPHSGHGYMTVESKLIPDSFLSHSHFRFDAVLNPVVRGGDRGRKVIPVKGRENVRNWFINKSNHEWGFIANQATLDIGNVDVLQFPGKTGQKITLAQARISGTLEVTDPDKFEFAFCRGLGRGTAFGCGMLLATPILESIY
mgnify:CR=1 FL=1|jgi:CRISPR system Cascade subunit CasE